MIRLPKEEIGKFTRYYDDIYSSTRYSFGDVYLRFKGWSGKRLEITIAFRPEYLKVNSDRKLKNKQFARFAMESNEPFDEEMKIILKEIRAYDLNQRTLLFELRSRLKLKEFDFFESKLDRQDVEEAYMDAFVDDEL